MSASCPACASARTKPAPGVRGYELRRCRDCLTVFVVDPPDVDETADLYGSDAYFLKDDGPHGDDLLGYGSDYLRDREHIEAKFAEVLARLEQRCPPGRLLDVGAGPGFLMSAARDRGWEARGLDLNPWAAAYARDELGLEVTTDTLEAAAFPDASFDAVTMMDVIEHLGHPDALIAEAARITRPEGVLVILTPDAGSLVSRALGQRWPEVRRVPEHLALFSVSGLTRLLERNGFEAYGWHHIGKTAAVDTLLADVSLAAPRLVGAARGLIAGSAVGSATVDLDPRTKFCLYAMRPAGAGADGAPPSPTPARMARRLRAERSTEDAILEELRSLADRRHLCDWMFEQVAPYVRGTVVEVGGGIGTFSERLLGAGAERLLVLEPDPACAQALSDRLGGYARVTVAMDGVPGSTALEGWAGSADFVLCQNVLEHIEDDLGAVRAMADALQPGGSLSLLVPAHPRLFGPLDHAYGHHRRYTPARLRSILRGAGLDPVDLYHFNLLGVPGWVFKNLTGSTRIGPIALRAYEVLALVWRAVERHWRPPVGLSLLVHARKPD